LLAQCALTSSQNRRGNRKTALKEAFSALMLAEPAAVAAAVQRLAARLRQQEAEGERPLGAKDALALRLNGQYPEVTAEFSAVNLQHFSAVACGIIHNRSQYHEHGTVSSKLSVHALTAPLARRPDSAPATLQ
jgi:hypothetical protein